MVLNLLIIQMNCCLGGCQILKVLNRTHKSELLVDVEDYETKKLWAAVNPESETMPGLLWQPDSDCSTAYIQII